MLDYLIPEQEVLAPDALVQQLAASPLQEPFTEAVLTFITELSRSILMDRALRDFPELIALAHWFRPSQLQAIKADFEQRRCSKIHRPRGLVFHIAPANVDSIFVYSWLLSLLVGNANLVRVSQRRNEQMRHFFSKVNKLLQDQWFLALRQANAVVSYGHDEAITALFSAACQMRVIWGGDDTIRQIRAISLSPLATELAFANRFSLALLKSQAVIDCGSEALHQLAVDFYNDAFWFNQQACSSPRAVFWIGDAAINQAAQQRFWPALGEVVMSKRPGNEPAQVMDRLTAVYQYSALHEMAKVMDKQYPLLTRIQLEALTAEDRNLHCGNGLFLELERKSLSDVPSILSPQDQTLIYFGFEKQDLISLLPDIPPHAADRMVPAGKALDFDVTWDGCYLPFCFTREIGILS